MKLRLEKQFAAENLCLKTRWLLIVACGVLLLDNITNPLVLAALVVLTLSNLVGIHFSSKLSTYEAKGKKYMAGIRVMDGVIVASAEILSGVRATGLYFLSIPILLSEAIVTRSRTRVAMLASGMLAIQLAAGIISGKPLPSLILPTAAIIFGAVAGVVLAGFQSREEVLASRDRRLQSVLECGTALAGSSDLKATILHTLQAAIKETGGTCGYVMLLNEENGTEIVTEAAFGVTGDFAFPDRLEIGSGMSGFVAKMGQPISISSSSEERQEYDGVTAGVRSACSVPLTTRGYSGGGLASHDQTLGVMTLLDLTQSDSFSNDDMELLRTLGGLMAVAVSNARMEERRRTTFLRTMESLATALEARDEYTRGHSQRVCEVSAMIGERMGFNAEAMEELRVGTILHDIGKIGVPDGILNKRARLTDEEFTVMKSHPVIGYDICKPLMLSEGVLMIIRNHHEKLDGSGYPDGLKGGELPLSLRIVCVADAFDAMSSRRPYRGVMETNTVLAELSRGAGTQFDPVVVEVLKDLLHTDRMHDLYRQYWDLRDVRAA